MAVLSFKICHGDIVLCMTCDRDKKINHRDKKINLSSWMLGEVQKRKSENTTTFQIFLLYSSAGHWHWNSSSCIQVDQALDQRQNLHCTCG